LLLDSPLLLSSMNKQALLVGNFLSHKTGSRGICEGLAARLPDVGWQVLCTSPKPNPFARSIDMVTSVWKNRSKFSVAQVDVYSGRAFRWAEAVCWTLRRTGKPYVLTLRGGNLPKFARRHPRRAKRLLKSAAAITAPSRYLAQQMRLYCDEVLLLPNPLDLSKYEFCLRERLRPRLIWLRAFHTMYNAPLAVKVMASLKSEFPDIGLAMVGPDKGDGSYGQVLQLAAELGVAEQCTFPGGVDKNEVPVWMNRGDVFLNTTNIDNTPVSVLEAMACGLCVVSTNVGGIPYLLQHEHDSLLVPPNDSAAMTTAVKRLLTEPGLAERLSRNAREKAEQCDWSIVLPQWDSLLISVVEGHLL